MVEYWEIRYITGGGEEQTEVVRAETRGEAREHVLTHDSLNAVGVTSVRMK